MVQPEFGEAPLAAHRGPGFQLPGDAIAMLLNRRALTCSGSIHTGPRNGVAWAKELLGDEPDRHPDTQ